VIAITPTPLIGREVPSEELDKIENEKVGGKHIRNGSMLNPPAKREMSYDSGIRNWFNPALVTNVPYRLKPSDSLVSTISMKKAEVVKRLLIKGASDGNTHVANGKVHLRHIYVPFGNRKASKSHSSGIHRQTT
jgi:hypothetical protein